MNRIRQIICAAAGVTGSMLAAGQASALEKGRIGATVDTALPVEFDIYVPVQNRPALEALETAQQTPGSQYHQWIGAKEFAARFGPTPAQIDRMRRELAASGLTVTQTHALSLHVTGNAGAVGRAFATTLATTRFSSGRAGLAATRPLLLTPALAANGAVVPAFSNMAHMTQPRLTVARGPDNRTSPTGSYWFDDLKQAYRFPSNQVVNGAGVTIGVLIEGGHSLADTQAYFAHEGLAAPSITEISLFGAPPYDSNDPLGSLEVQLDVQQAGGMAPGAAIIHYNIPDLDDSTLLAALTRIDEDNEVDVVNMSFSMPEIAYTAAYNDGQDMTGIIPIYDDLFALGNAEGITFVGSTGDFGARPIPAAACFEPGATASCGGFVASAKFPASSPHVTAVGGTNLVTSFTPGNLASTYARENADADPLIGDLEFGTPATGALWGSGGGASFIFGKPGFQRLVPTGAAMRSIPDVALHMGGCPDIAVQPCGPDRSNGDVVGISDGFVDVIGTSDAAPDFTGLTALKIQWLGTRLGNENPEIYGLAARQLAGGPRTFRQNIPGNNGLFTTKAKGYNEVIGNGSVIGTAFLLDPLMPAAGDPQTPSNP